MKATRTVEHSSGRKVRMPTRQPKPKPVDLLAASRSAILWHLTSGATQVLVTVTKPVDLLPASRSAISWHLTSGVTRVLVTVTKRKNIDVLHDGNPAARMALEQVERLPIADGIAGCYTRLPTVDALRDDLIAAGWRA